MEQQFVVFELGEEHYGVDIATVDGIIKMQEITGLPKAPDFIEGVTNLRGLVIPVLDLRKRFELEMVELTADSRIVVINMEDIKVGMIVDAVSEVLQINEEDIEPTPPMISSLDTAFITGITNLEDASDGRASDGRASDRRLIILLDLGRVLSVREKGVLESLPEPV